MTHLIEDDATHKSRNLSDQDATIWLQDELFENDYDLIFWGNDDVDLAGHNYGFDPDVPEYIAEIEQIDG